MADAQKIDWQNADYIWANFSLYGKVKGLKMYDMSADIQVQDVREETLINVMEASSRAEVQMMLTERICYENGEKIVLSIIRDDDRIYLAEHGAIRYLKETYDSDWEKSAIYIARIATPRKLCLIGEFLCMAIKSETPSAEDFEEMISLLWKIQKFGGCGYV